MYANPALYEQASQLQQRDSFQLIQRIKSDFAMVASETGVKQSRSPLTVLDIGCGTGIDSEKIYELLKPVDQIVAFDTSKDMIEFAQKRTNPSIPDGKIRYLEADICEPFEVLSNKLNLQEGSVDLVVSFYCFHWVEDKPTAIANIERFLKPSGRMYLIISTWNDVYPIQPTIVRNPKWAPFLMKSLPKLKAFMSGEKPSMYNVNGEKSPSSQGVIRPSEVSLHQLWERLCHGGHLNLLEMNFHYGYFPYYTVEQFYDLMHGVNFWLEYIPIEMHPEFLQDLFELLRVQYVEGQIEKQKELNQTIWTEKEMELFRFNYNYATIVSTKLA